MHAAGVRTQCGSSQLEVQRLGVDVPGLADGGAVDQDVLSVTDVVAANEAALISIHEVTHPTGCVETVEEE